MKTGSQPAPPLLPLHETALFLDFDGTIAPIAPTPDSVTVAPEMAQAVGRLRERLGDALAIVSGRPIVELDRLLVPVRTAAAGVHGAELRLAADGPIEQRGEKMPDALHARLLEIVERLRIRSPGVLGEDKGRAFAIHYRLAPEAVTALRDMMQGLVLDPPWRILPGHRVFEITSATLGKGEALKALMAEKPFAGRRPVFVGDDRTDLDGMDAAIALGGAGIAVGAIDALQAQWRLDNVAAVGDWLARLAAA